MDRKDTSLMHMMMHLSCSVPLLMILPSGMLEKESILSFSTGGYHFFQVIFLGIRTFVTMAVWFFLMKDKPMLLGPLSYVLGLAMAMVVYFGAFSLPGSLIVLAFACAHVSFMYRSQIVVYMKNTDQFVL